VSERTPATPAPAEQSLAERLGDVPGPATPRHPEIATWRGATREDIDAIHVVIAAADAVDHPTWTTPRSEIADTFEMSHFDNARDTILAETADGTVVAVGSAMLHPSREGGVLNAYLTGGVHPDWRRRGIGAQVLAWQHARGRQQVAEAAAALGAEATADLKIYAEETNAGQHRLARAAGFRPERWFATMVRDMATPAPRREAPEGITVVPYERALDAAVLEARNDAFRDHWGSLPSVPERWAQFVGGEFFRPDLSRLALDGDRIVAFCLASVNEDDWVTLGASNSYIDLIGVVRSHRGRGIAPLIIAHALEAIGAAGLEKAVLDVDTDSPTGANTLYERLGFAATERSVAFVQRL